MHILPFVLVGVALGLVVWRIASRPKNSPPANAPVWFYIVLACCLASMAALSVSVYLSGQTKDLLKLSLPATTLIIALAARRRKLRYNQNQPGPKGQN